MDYYVYSPSYKRAHIAKTHKLFKPELFRYIIRKEEEEVYRKHLGPDVTLVTIPEGRVSNIANTRNWILDYAECQGTKLFVMVDDDISNMSWIKERQCTKMSVDELDIQIKRCYDIALEFGVGLWGVNLINDPMAYYLTKPLGFNNPCLGPFCAHILDDLRYDESLPLKEDYDFFLQKVNRYKRCLRFEMLAYQCDHLGLEGGCQTYRTTEAEREQNKLLIKKWGSKIIRENERNKDSINMRIRL